MSKCIPSSQMVQAINLISSQADLNQAQSIANRDKADSIQQGGMQEWILPDLSAIGPAGNTAQVRYESSGVWLYLAKSGTSRGAIFSLELTGGKTFTSIVPGTFIRGKFDGFSLTNTGVLAGRARWVLGQSPDVEYNEENIEGSGAAYPAVGASLTENYNVAVNTTNVPSGVQSGAIAINGGRAVRAYVASTNGNITAGTIRWWIQDTSKPAQFGTNTWWLSPNTEALSTGRANVVSSDMEIGVANGNVYAEVYGFTNAGGSGGPVVTLEVL